MEVHKSSGYYEDVKQLMGVEPDITLAREESLWYTGSIQRSTSDVQTGHECQPAYLPHCGCLEKALRDDKVQGGDDTTEAETQKYSCSYPSVLRGCKHIPLGDYYGCNAQDTNHDQVDEAGLRVAIEGVVKPWNKAAHDEKCDARVIQLGEEPRDTF